MQVVVGGVDGAQSLLCGVAGVFVVGLLLFQTGEFLFGRACVRGFGQGLAEAVFQLGASSREVGQRGFATGLAACFSRLLLEVAQRLAGFFLLLLRDGMRFRRPVPSKGVNFGRPTSVHF
ncbi:hypothetical protein PH213_35905 [Streptomyces sp. SRF1]|uniref:hypothetical protein n=1 Tax=Streptomyces sp. SRF1 TaxID=1549642 RepID=UPI0025B243DD|nr:hypothetical protein [Streptomyces sp. SRF1]MDN3059816.1 hypothetical protein [Streptomyces sp. SRF1]